MIKDFLMPKLAMAMNEGTINAWLVEEGAWVEKGAMLVEVETEKELGFNSKRDIENYGLDNFMSNRVDVRNPRSEYMLKEFEDIVKGEMPLPDGNTYGFVSELNKLQRDILSVLEVPLNYYDYQFLFDSS